MSSGHDGFLKEWHRVVAEKDVAGIPELLADEVTLGAPPYWARFQGRELVQHLLGLILETVEEFTYHREWRQGDELALEFTGRVGDRELQGIDLITLDQRFLVRNLDVLMRPMNGVEALRDAIAPKMASFLAGRGAA